MDENTTHDPGHDSGPRFTTAEIRDVNRLRRSASDRHVAGVAGGLARHLDVDPVILRVAFVVSAFFGGAGLLLYGALWLLVPEEAPADADLSDPAQQPRATVDLDPRSRGLAIVIAGSLAVLLLIGDVFGTDRGDGFWLPVPLVLAAGLAVWFVVGRRHRRERRAAWLAANPGHPAAAAAAASAGTWAAQDVPPHPATYVTDPRDMGGWKLTGDPHQGWTWQRDPRKRGPLLFWIAVPLIALALGTLGCFDLAGVDVVDSAYPALALGIVAAFLLLGAFWGRAGGLILLGLFLVPVTAIATAASELPSDITRYAPTNADQIPEFGYRLGAGELVVDLTQVPPAQLDGRELAVSADVGRIEVIVPASGLDVTATAHANGPGGYEIFGEHGGGIDAQLTTHHDVTDEVGHLIIDAEIDLGEITIRSER